METTFGRDFTSVRIHSDSRADQAARSISALAFTVGDRIGFSASRYAPTTLPGRELLAHELTHVIQQSAAHDNFVGSYPIEAESEARRNGKLVAAGIPATVAGTVPTTLQRQASDEAVRLDCPLALTEAESRRRGCPNPQADAEAMARAALADFPRLSKEEFLRKYGFPDDLYDALSRELAHPSLTVPSMIPPPPPPKEDPLILVEIGGVGREMRQSEYDREVAFSQLGTLTSSPFAAVAYGICGFFTEDEAKRWTCAGFGQAAEGIGAGLAGIAADRARLAETTRPVGPSRPSITRSVTEPEIPPTGGTTSPAAQRLPTTSTVDRPSGTRPQPRNIQRILEQNRRVIPEEIRTKLKSNISNYRSNTGIPRVDLPNTPGEPVRGGVVATARTDIPGLDQKPFGGASPAALPEQFKGRPGFTGGRVFKPANPVEADHAEQVLVENIRSAIEQRIRSRTLNPEDLTGRTVHILVEQEPCPSCASGLGSERASGVLKQFSQLYPGLTVQIENLRTSRTYVIRGGTEVKNP